MQHQIYFSFLSASTFFTGYLECSEVGRATVVRILRCQPDLNVNAVAHAMVRAHLSLPLCSPVSQQSRAALQQAVVNGHINVVRVLPADPRTSLTAQDEDCMTAFHLAVRRGDRELVALLVATAMLNNLDDYDTPASACLGVNFVLTTHGAIYCAITLSSPAYDSTVCSTPTTKKQ